MDDGRDIMRVQHGLTRICIYKNIDKINSWIDG